jgi:hypothetical protein
VIALIRRPFVIAILGLVVVVAVILTIALARSRTAGCTVPPPEPNLPAPLRTLGELTQPLDPADQRALADASVRAATALHGDLAGARADTVVREAATGSAQHDALVVPLSLEAQAGQRRVVGLVAYLLDCSGRAYYHDVDDLLRTNPGILPTRFPTVSAEEAAALLGSKGPPRLVYRDTPFKPLWQDAATGRSLSAGVT